MSILQDQVSENHLLLAQQSRRSMTRSFSKKSTGALSIPESAPDITPDDVLLAIQHNLNDRKMRGIDLFRKFDTTQDGNLSQAEFCKGLKEMEFQATEDMISMLMSRLDSDSSGEISLKELDRELRHAEKAAIAEGRNLEEVAAKVGLVNYGASRMKLSKATLTKRERANSKRFTKSKSKLVMPLDAIELLLLKIVDALDQRKTRAKDFFHKLDTSGDNDVSSEEFRTGMEHLGVQVTQEDMKSIMARLDMDGSGDINVLELDKALQAAKMHRQAASRSSLSLENVGAGDDTKIVERALFHQTMSSIEQDGGSSQGFPTLDTPRKTDFKGFLRYRPPAKPTPRRTTVGYSPSMCKTPPRVGTPPDWAAILGPSEAAEVDGKRANPGGIYVQRMFVPANEQKSEQVNPASPSRPAPLEERQRIEWRIQDLILDKRKCRVRYRGMLVAPGNSIMSQSISIAGVQGNLRFWPNGFFNHTQKTRFCGETHLEGMDIYAWCAVGLCMPAGTHFRLRFFVGPDRSEVRECYWGDASDVHNFWLPPVRDVPSGLADLVVGVEVTQNCRHLRPKEASPRRTPRIGAVLPSLGAAASPRMLPVWQTHRGPPMEAAEYRDFDGLGKLHGARTDVGLSLPSPRFICPSELRRIPPRCAVAQAPVAMRP